MNSTFMNLENIKTSDHHRLMLNLANTTNLKRCCLIKNVVSAIRKKKLKKVI